MAKEKMRRRRASLERSFERSFEQSENTPAEQDVRTIAPRKDMDLASFSEYVSYAYTIRAQLVRGEVSLRDLSFRQLFNFYLLTSILYYKHDVSFISDEIFDRLCGLLVERKKEAKTSIFWHGKLFDLEMLKAGSGFHLHINNTPIYLQNAAMVVSESRQAPWEAVIGAAQQAYDTPALPMKRKRIAIDCKTKTDLPTKRRRAKL